MLILVIRLEVRWAHLGRIGALGQDFLFYRIISHLCSNCNPFGNPASRVKGMWGSFLCKHNDVVLKREPDFSMLKLLGSFWGPLGSSWGALGDIWGLLGKLLGCTWGLLETSWGALRVLLKPVFLEGLRKRVFPAFFLHLPRDLGPKKWGVWESSWLQVEGSGGHLGSKKRPRQAKRFPNGPKTLSRCIQDGPSCVCVAAPTRFARF